MSAESCPVCGCTKQSNLREGLECGGLSDGSECHNAPDLAIERAVELDAIKTAMGCQGMSLADVLRVIRVMQDAAVQEAGNGEVVDSYLDEFGNNVTVTKNHELKMRQK